MSAPPIDPEVRQRLLELVGIGVSFEGACLRLKLAPRDVQRDGDLMAEVLDVHREASTKLEERLFALLLKSNDAKAMAQVLERRQAAEAALVGAARREAEDLEAGLL
jgi:hypothetical protein